MIGGKIQSKNSAPLYIFLMLMGTGMALGKSLIFAKLLTVSEFGYFALFNIILSYGTIVFQFGLLNGLNRELPVAIGKGDNERAFFLRNTVLTSMAFLVLVLFVPFMLVVYWMEMSSKIRTIMMIGYVGSAISVFYQYTALELRGRQLLLPFSLVYFLQAFITFIIGALGCLYWGLKGAIASVLLGFLLVIGIVMKFWIKRIRLVRIQREDINYLLRIGIPLLMSTSCYIFASSMDRIFIAKSLGVSELGQYQFAFTVFTIGASLGGIVAQWVSPQILHKHGGGTDPARNFARILKIMAGIGVLILIAWYPFLIISDFIVERFFQRYVEVISLFQIFYFAAGVKVMNQAGVMINVFNKQFVGLGWTILVTFVLFSCYFAATMANAPLMTFAKILLVGQILFTGMNVGLGFWFLQKNGSFQVRR